MTRVRMTCLAGVARRRSTSVCPHITVSPPPSPAGMRPCPPDALPYMGRIPGWSGAYINAGHNCWGIAWAPACGRAMAELVLEGSSRVVDLGPFDPARFTDLGRKRGGRGRKRGSVSVGEQW